MTYVMKGAGAGLSKIGDVTKALKGVGKIDIPTLPDGSFHLPDGSFPLPDGSVHLPDGRILDPQGHLTTPEGVVDPTPIPHEPAPGLPASWTLPGGQHPVYAAAHSPGDTLTHTADTLHQSAHGHGPGPTPHGHGPGPTSYEHTTTHAPPHETPGATTHPAHETPGAPHDGAHGGDHPHDGAHGGDHDGAGHPDDAAHTGDHATPAHAVADATTHHVPDGPGPTGHADPNAPGGHGGPGEPFEYKPSMSPADFNRLTDDEKHAVAAAELSDGTVPFRDDVAAIAYGRDYWNDYVDQLDPSAKQALTDYTGEGFPSYHDMNGYLRGTGGYGPHPDTLNAINEVDRVLSTRPVPEDLMVVRGSGLDHLGVDSPGDMIGNTYGDKGYTSTSLGNHPVGAFKTKPAILHLRVPKGTPALWLERVSEFDVSERELLLARGSEYKVTRAFMDSAGKWQVYGELLPRT